MLMKFIQTKLKLYETKQKTMHHVINYYIYEESEIFYSVNITRHMLVSEKY